MRKRKKLLLGMVTIAGAILSQQKAVLAEEVRQYPEENDHSPQLLEDTGQWKTATDVQDAAAPVYEEDEGEGEASQLPSGEVMTEEAVPSSEEVAPLSLSELESELANSIYDTVNELRYRNNIPLLERNPKLDKAAGELVKLDPISPDFIKKYGNAHALDNTKALEQGYRMQTAEGEDFPTPANHSVTDYRKEDLLNRSFRDIAADFVNKWFLDYSEPHKAHRRQLLSPLWNETGIGVNISPLTLSDLERQELANKEGLIYEEDYNVWLLNGFKIAVTQYYGSGKAVEEVENPSQGMALSSYGDFVKNQIGREEYNPNTGQLIKLTPAMAEQAITEQEKIEEAFLEEGDLPSSEEVDAFLLENKRELARPSEEYANFIQGFRYDPSLISQEGIYQELLDKVIKLSSEKLAGNEKARRRLVLYYESEMLNQWKMIVEGEDFSFYPLTTPLHSSLDEEHSMLPANVFDTVAEADAYGEYILNEFLKDQEDKYYYYAKEMLDGKYSTWFSEKKLLDRSTKRFLEENYHKIGVVEGLGQPYHRELALRRFVDFAYEIDNMGQLHILDSTPLLNEGELTLYEDLKDPKQAPLAIPDYYFVRKGYPVNPFYRPLNFEKLSIFDPTGSNLFEGNDLYILDVYQRPYHPEIFPNYGWAKGAADESFQSFETLPDYAKQARWMFPEELLSQAKTPEDKLNLFTYRVERFPWGDTPASAVVPYYFIVYPKYFDRVNFDRGRNGFSNIDEVVDYTVNSLPKDVYSSVIAATAPAYVLDTYPGQALWPEAFRFELQTERQKNQPGVYGYYDDADVWLDRWLTKYAQDRTQRFHVFQIGDLKAYTMSSIYNDPTTAVMAFSSAEDAIQVAEAYVAEHPEYVYTLFQAEDVYIVQYGTDMMETRWQPDNFYFVSPEAARRFGEYLQGLDTVKEYEFEVIPMKNFHYGLKTTKLVYADDQKAYLFIPAYLGSGNAGISGQHFDQGGRNLTNVFAEMELYDGPLLIKQKEPEGPVISEEPSELPQANLPSDNGDPIRRPESLPSRRPAPDAPRRAARPIYIAPTIARIRPPQLVVRGAAPSTSASARQEQLDQGRRERLRVLADENTMQALVRIIARELPDSERVELPEEIRRLYTYYIDLQFIFTEVSQRALDEAVEVEFILADDDEVTSVVRLDAETGEVIEELDFEIVETEIDGQSQRVLKFSVIESGIYGVKTK